MKVLICGEGAHDIGETDFWCAQTRTYVSLEGWMQPLVRRIIGRDPVELSIKKRRDLTILPNEIRRLQPLPKGHGAKALFAKRAAILGGYDAVVFMADADDPSEKRWQEICEEIFEGFSRIDSEILSVACVPRSASESWLLSDKDAWRHVSGEEVDLPAKPEEIWGLRDDPDGGHPHRLFARCCVAANMPDERKTRLALAEASDLSIMAQRCPVSFVHFQQQLQAA